MPWPQPSKTRELWGTSTGRGAEGEGPAPQATVAAGQAAGLTQVAAPVFLTRSVP